MVKQSWKFTLLHVGLIGYAAQIRPVLVLFPFINVLLLWMLAHKRHLAGSARTKVLLAGSTCALLLLCNAPSIRNYINYRLFMPSDLLAVNMFDFLERGLAGNGRLDIYEEMCGELKMPRGSGKRPAWQSLLNGYLQALPANNVQNLIIQRLRRHVRCTLALNRAFLGLQREGGCRRAGPYGI